MKAEEARKIYEQAQKENANRWYEEFQKKLFNAIRKQSESRCDELIIGSHDDLNVDGFISCSPLRNRLKEELEKLGYKVSYNDHREGDYITISWKV